jgi:hypothetical protein
VPGSMLWDGRDRPVQRGLTLIHIKVIVLQ